MKVLKASVTLCKTVSCLNVYLFCCSNTSKAPKIRALVHTSLMHGVHMASVVIIHLLMLVGLSWKQYILKKCSRFGMKSFVLCEASSGYLWRSVLYTGEELTNNLDTVYRDFNYVASKAVLLLMGKLLDKGHRLFIDNWYTSFEIAHTLLDHDTDVIGTLHKDRKNFHKS